MRPLTVTVAEFEKNFARYQEKVRQGQAVCVTKQGRLIGAFISEQQLRAIGASATPLL